eukprot:2162719-Amphidinium_carterae.1
MKAKGPGNFWGGVQVWSREKLPPVERLTAHVHSTTRIFCCMAYCRLLQNKKTLASVLEGQAYSRSRLLR